MEELLKKVASDVLKDRLEEDVKAKYDAFKKTKEFTDLVKKYLKEHMRVECYNLIMDFKPYKFEELVKEEITKTLKTEKNRSLIMKACEQAIEDKLGFMVDDIMDDDKIWNLIAGYVQKILADALKLKKEKKK